MAINFNFRLKGAKKETKSDLEVNLVVLTMHLVAGGEGTAGDGQSFTSKQACLDDFADALELMLTSLLRICRSLQ